MRNVTLNININSVTSYHAGRGYCALLELDVTPLEVSDSNFSISSELELYYELLCLGLGCTTVISTEGAGLAAAQMIGLTNHVVWSSLRGKQLNTACKLMDTDYKTNH